MVHGSAFPLIAAACMLLAGCTPTAPVELTAGDRLPSAISARVGVAAEPQLVWVLSEQDCLSCTAGLAAAVVRRLQQRFGDGVRTTLLLIGTDSVMVRNVLELERVRAVISLIPSDAHASLGLTPLLLVTHQDRIVSVARLGSDALAVRAHGERLEESLSSVLGGSPLHPPTQALP